jgi:hypothetical protein
MRTSKAPSVSTLQFLWTAIGSATFAFAAILFSGLRAAGELPPLFPLVVSLAALGILVASVVLPAQVQQNALRNRKLSIVERVDPSSAFANYRGAVGKRRFFEDREAAQRAAIDAATVPTILRAALTESIALFGFVLGYLNAPAWQWLPFFVTAWLAFAVRFPTGRRVFGALEKARGATIPS